MVSRPCELTRVCVNGVYAEMKFRNRDTRTVFPWNAFCSADEGTLCRKKNYRIFRKCTEPLPTYFRLRFRFLLRSYSRYCVSVSSDAVSSRNRDEKPNYKYHIYVVEYPCGSSCVERDAEIGRTSNYTRRTRKVVRWCARWRVAIRNFDVRKTLRTGYTRTVFRRRRRLVSR
jgi:hypothetical protein